LDGNSYRTIVLRPASAILKFTGGTPIVTLSPAVLAPINAKLSFSVFLEKQSLDALVGDLEERYRVIRRTFGKRLANLWYWTQAFRSVGPIAWAATRAVVKKLSGLAALVELYRKIGR
jgi:hypothetical protein